MTTISTSHSGSGPRRLPGFVTACVGLAGAGAWGAGCFSAAPGASCAPMHVCLGSLRVCKLRSWLLQRGGWRLFRPYADGIRVCRAHM